MNLQYGMKRSILRPSHTMYFMSILAILQNISSDYVSKMTYNKDKDLVFVYKPDGFWNDSEYVFEAHHLERMVPKAVTSFKNLGAMRDDGILTVHCMATKDYMKFYNEDKYWNLDLKDEFMDTTGNMWRGYTNKYSGSNFFVNGHASEDIALTQMKVDRELEEAIAKHGEVELPRTYEEKFYEGI